jgi:hypothetical protein
MWKVEYGDGKVQWFSEKTNLDVFVDTLKNSEIKYKVSQGTPDEYPDEKGDPKDPDAGLIDTKPQEPAPETEDSKKDKFERSLDEFEAEIITNTGTNIVIRNENNGKKYWLKNIDGKFSYDPKSPSKMPKSMEKSVLSILRKISAEELKNAYGDDAHPVDISVKGNNLLINPDKGRSWKIPLPF